MKYKVGDKVRIKSLDWYNKNKDEYNFVNCDKHLFYYFMSKCCGNVFTISDVYSDFYRMSENNHNWTDEMIEGLVEEEEIEFTEEDKYWCDIMSESDPTTYVLPEGYIFKDENGNVINATKIVLEKKKKEYPKTYEECCLVLEYMPHTNDVIGYKWDVLKSLQKLIIARDAYWKIAGEEMGLGKPWEPDWKNEDEKKWVISRYRGELDFGFNTGPFRIFAFPTEEMRDAFYENFKSGIEICKELL